MKKETADKELEVKVGQEAKHPLMEFVPIVFNSFEEWLGRWNGTNYLDEKLGLLHSLITKTGWWIKPELILFLLSVADGYTDKSFSDDRVHVLYGQPTEAENRKSIASKAFSVLCLKYFRSEKKEEPLWWWLLEHEVLFQKVLWFLRRRTSISNRLCNCSLIHNGSDDHQQEIFRNFLRKFSRLGWDFRCPESRRYWDEKTRQLIKKRILAARPQLIDVLCELGELNWLNGRDLELDAKSIKRLTEIALSNSVFLPSEKVSDGCSSLRKPKNLEEAVLGGSIAAQVVLLHQIREKERRRISILYEESVRQYEDQQKVAELDLIKNKKMELEKRAGVLTNNKV